MAMYLGSNKVEMGQVSSGGSTEPLVCRYDFELGHLDVTCGQIEESALNGTPIYMIQNESGNSYELCMLQSFYLFEYEEGSGTGMYIEFKGGTLTCYAETLTALRASYPYFAD